MKALLIALLALPAAVPARALAVASHKTALPTSPAALEKARQELLTDMSHWALACRPDAADEQVQVLAQRLGELRREADAKLDMGHYAALSDKFEAWKNDFSNHMYSRSGAQMDALDFRRDLEQGIGKALAPVAESRRLTQKQIRAAQSQLAPLRRAVGPVLADYLFDHSKTGGNVGLLAAARAQGPAGEARIFSGYVGTPRVLKPDGRQVPVVDPTAAGMPDSASDSQLVSYVAQHWGFSTAYAWCVVKTARMFGVNPMVPLAMMRQESHGNSNATSSAGAGGLMQLMPATARALGVPLRKLYDAEWNIWGGVKYVKQLTAQLAARGYHGVQYVLAAYNAGPGAVFKSGGVPAYRETMGYVANISANLAELTRAFGSGQPR